MFGRLVVVGFFLLWPLVGAEAGNEEMEQAARVEQICRKFAAIQPPEEDRPDRKTLAALAGCDDEALYYGIGRPTDPVAAKACAFANFGNGPFSGEALLMTIYANGVGTPRRLDVALGFACRDFPERVEYLHGLLRSNWTGSDYSWCTGITDSVNAGFCAGHDARIAGAKRNETLVKLAGRWGSGESADRFAKLKEAFTALVKMRADNEVDQSGTLRAALVIVEEEALAEQFVEDLQGFAQGAPPCLGAEKKGDADARMNAIYRKIQRAPSDQYKDNHGTIEQDGIKATQRVWLRYRDAWVSFVAAAFPTVPKDAVMNWLTLRRIAQLEELAD